jgi:caa(3)-type oxidase subunit IV
MDAHDTAAFKKHIRQYIGVFVALLVATVLTVAVSYVHFGAEDSHVGNVTVALIIAGIKAALVAGFFMHLVLGETLDLHDAGHHRGVFRGVDRADGFRSFTTRRDTHDAKRGWAWPGGDGGGRAWALKHFIWFCGVVVACFACLWAGGGFRVGGRAAGIGQLLFGCGGLVAARAWWVWTVCAEEAERDELSMKRKMKRIVI